MRNFLPGALSRRAFHARVASLIPYRRITRAFRQSRRGAIISPPPALPRARRTLTGPREPWHYFLSRRAKERYSIVLRNLTHCLAANRQIPRARGRLRLRKRVAGKGGDVICMEISKSRSPFLSITSFTSRC